MLVDVGLSPNPAYPPAPVQMPTRLSMLLHALDVAIDLSHSTWLSYLSDIGRTTISTQSTAQQELQEDETEETEGAHAGFAPTTLAERVHGDLNLRWSSHTGASAFTVCTCVHTDEATAMPSTRRTLDG